MTTPMPDPPGPGPSPADDSPTSPLDLPPFTTAEAPPPAPSPGSIPPGAPPSGAVPSTRAEPQPSGQPALVVGIILVIVGAVVLVTRVADASLGADAWPLWIIVPGVAMLVASFAVPPRGGLGLAVPGAIIATVGLVLWVQEANDAYATWAYAWALVAPAAAGAGTMLYGLARGDRELAGDGFRTMLVGLALFGGFALFFEGVIGLSGEPVANLDEVLPYGLIALGVLFVVLSFVAPRRRTSHQA